MKAFLRQAKATIFLMLLLLLSCINLHSQIGPVKNTIVPPSPSSTIYRQYTGYSPGYSTGSVSIPVPIYEIRVGEYSLPVTLQYGTNGIKVDDDPYPAGYGWMLQPGLRITCTIMGRSDVLYKKDIRQGETNFMYFKKAMYDSRRGESQIADTSCRDTQYDIFSVHLPGGDYSFILTASGNTYVAVTEGNLLKIEYQSSNNMRFKVTDDKGVIYYFSPYEYNLEDICTGWVLTRIELPGTGNVIDFTWGLYYHSGLVPGTVTGGNTLKDYKPAEYGSGGIEAHAQYENAQDVGLLTGGVMYGQMAHLTGITFPTGSLSITYKSGSNPLIDNITVMNKYSSIIKRACFTYGTGMSAALLNEIDITGEGKYVFGYNPQRFTNYYAQDYWGYYNGKDNLSLPPRMQIRSYDNQIGSEQYVLYGYADRSIDTTAMKANILTRITYPTKGYTDFYYEPHEFTGTAPTTVGLGPDYRYALSKGGGLRLRSMVTTSSDGTSITKWYKYGSGENGKGNIVFEPTLDTFIDEFYAYDCFGANAQYPTRGINFRLLFVNMQSNCAQYNFNTPAVWYDCVTEYSSDDSKTVYTFSHPVPLDVFPQTVVKDFTHRGIFSLNNLFSKGCILTNEKQYKKVLSGYILAEETTYNYSVTEDPSKRILSLFVNRYQLNIMGNGPDFYLTSAGHIISPNDGLGFPKELVQKGITPTGGNLSSMSEYNSRGLLNREWLPCATTGSYTEPSTLKSSIISFYGGDTAPYNSTVYESSPSARPVSVYGPGAAWSSKPVQTAYLSNSSSGTYSCKYYYVTGTGGLAQNGVYGSGELHVTSATDEDGAVTLVFTDKLGQNVLTRRLNGEASADTYSVYDDFGNLCYVLTPMYQSTANTDLYAYRYIYDSKNRCTEKQAPGVQTVKYIYDSADRLIFTQDGNQRAMSTPQWTFFLYDKWG